MTLFFLLPDIHAETPVQQILSRINSMPTTFYSPQAYTYFTQKGSTLPAQVSAADITKNLQMIIRLAARGNDAKEIIPALLTSYPKAVHVTEIRNVHYKGEGTFNDWVYTYVASEKNKFLLASPFLDYNTMSLCEHFIESHYDITLPNGEPVTMSTREPVVITVTHTLYPAAYTLSALTGQQFGTDLAQWQEWWRANSETYSGPPAVPAVGPDGQQMAIPAVFGKLQSGQEFSDILLHGKYQLALTTGAFLTGKVEFKSDTSLVLECVDGKAYSLKPSLISRFEVLAPPPSAAPAVKSTPSEDSLPFSFDELRGKPESDRLIEVRVNSGMVFRGKCKTIDESMMQLDVGGSIIPISRDVTLNIKFVPVNQNAAAPDKAKQTKNTANAAQDTVYEKNPTTDDWGVPGPDIINVGLITAEKPECVVMRVAETNAEKTIPRGMVVRIIKHSSNSYDTDIKRYAKALFCPQDMFIVDVPPGKEGRPFFKVCVDRYEFPNVKGAVPKTGVSYDEAQLLCEQKGKRLCTADEWKFACGGIEQYTYPYGWNPEKEKCNSDDKRPPEESGTRINCVSKFGGYDMVGNVFEWVTDAKKQPSTMGGPYSKCQTIPEGVGGSAKPRVGLRCCKGN